MKVLFVCTANQLRSPTAAAVFADEPGLDTRSAGVDMFCPQPVNAELVNWADRILAMEHVHKKIIEQRFGPHLGETSVSVLDIPDMYDYMQPELVTLLQERVPPLLR